MSTEASSAIGQRILPPDVFDLSAPEGADAVPASTLPREGKLWLVVTVIMFVTGLFKGINLLVYLAYLLAGIWLLNYWMLRRDLRRVQARRLPGGPIFAGEPHACSLEVACTGKQRVRGLVILDRSDTGNRKWLVLALQPRTLLRIRWSETFPVRGRRRVDALRIYSSFPFGLSTRGVNLGTMEEWIVLPHLGRVHVEQLKHWLARALRGDGRMRRRQLLPSAQEADIHGLRDFRVGDSPRWIHWKTSARRGQLLVREFEERSQPHLVLVVEPWLPQAPNPDDRRRLETAISLAGTIVRDWCKDPSLRLTVVVAGEEPIVLKNGAGGEFALRSLEVLAVEQGRAEDRSIAWLHNAPRIVRIAPILVVSSKRDSSLAAALRGELGRPAASLDAGDQPPWYELPRRFV